MFGNRGTSGFMYVSLIHDIMSFRYLPTYPDWSYSLYYDAVTNHLGYKRTNRSSSRYSHPPSGNPPMAELYSPTARTLPSSSFPF